MNNSENIIKSYGLSPASLIPFMKNSLDSWYIKDQHLRFIYMNKTSLDALNLPEKFECEGKLDKAIPAKPCEELWEKFISHDQKVITENRHIPAIAHYGKDGKGNLTDPVPFWADKAPLYDDKNKIIGIVGHNRIVDALTLLLYMDRLNKKAIQFDAPNDIFTKRERDVIFWVQQRLSSKKIAKRLNLAQKTIENRLQFIYEKTGVHSIIQLIEYCKQTGLDSYIPYYYFIRNGFQLFE